MQFFNVTHMCWKIGEPRLNYSRDEHLVYLYLPSLNAILLLVITGRFVWKRCDDAEQQLQEGAGHEKNERTELQIHALLCTHSCSVSVSDVSTHGQSDIKMIGEKQNILCYDIKTMFVLYIDLPVLVYTVINLCILMQHLFSKKL